MLKFTAGYAATNNNFVIQNLDTPYLTDNVYYPWLCVIKNLLQRACPVKLSEFLQQHFWDVPFSWKFVPLLSRETPVWRRTIKWDSQKNLNPALDFFNAIPHYFGKDYAHFQQLLRPEVPINFITWQYNKDFYDQKVDFYLPQALLVIEIDGRNEFGVHGYNDKERDIYLEKFGIQTIRIDTKDIYQNTDQLQIKIQEIKDRIQVISHRIKEQNEDSHTFFDYPKIDYTYPNVAWTIQLTAIMRFQILLLELLMRWKLSFDQQQVIEIKSDMGLDFTCFELALKDLWLWLENIYNLQKLPLSNPPFLIKKVKDFSVLSHAIKVDFSVYKRWTDENIYAPDVIFVRTDYFDPLKEEGHWGIGSYDYFRMMTTSPITYAVRDDNSWSLKFFLKNLIGYEDFRSGQLPIIQNILSNRDTIGLLPTGSGKSLCFHLACLLQPAINFVVCPIKSLMIDQEQELKNFWIQRISSITSDHSAPEKEKIQSDFGDKKLFLVLISPERFQTKEFRSYLASLDHLAYAVIDEIHCLSEWGHDFRTSYLCLAKTIKAYCKNIKFLGLTATASANVLKDIQIELGIFDKTDIKTLSDFSRPELEFIVKDDAWMKFQMLTGLLKDEIEWLAQKKNGIVFTPFVGGDYGCYQLSNKLSSLFEEKVGWFAGSIPQTTVRVQYGNSVTMQKKPVMSESEFTEYKLSVQKKFKEGELSLLAATKAFWMGVNKKDVYFTVHYWIPGSMESLYQEGWRAGRDKELLFAKEGSAKCYVLLWKENKSELLKAIFDPKSDFETVKQAVNDMGYQWWDIKSNLFLRSQGEEDIASTAKNIVSLYNDYMKEKQGVIILKSQSLFLDEEENRVKIPNKFFDKTEKYLYRLMLLGIILDYTVSWQGIKSFRVQLAKINEQMIKQNLVRYIEKYEKGTLRKYEQQFAYISNPLEKYVSMLLQWSYDHHSYHRRQSLKNLYENCLNVIWEGTEKIDNLEFKKRLEDYFKMDDNTYLMQDVADSLEYLDKRSTFFWIKDIEDPLQSKRFITKDEVEEIRGPLSRLLESYQNSVGLNLISGMLRLMLDQFDDGDGRERLENALSQLKKMKEDVQMRQIIAILEIGKQFPLYAKDSLAESVLKYFPSIYLFVHSFLQDNHSLNIALNKTNKLLLSSYKKLHGKFKATRRQY